MKCRMCGSEIDEKNKWCPECGAEIKANDIGADDYKNSRKK